MTYRFYNANAKGNFVNDCVIRAISLAECNSWDKTYEKLSDMAQRDGRLFDDVVFVDEYLDRNYQSIPHYAEIIGELCDEYPMGTFLVTTYGHITTIKNGVLYDTFDCRDREILGVWKVR